MNRRTLAGTFVFAVAVVFAGVRGAAASPQSVAIPAYFYPSYPDPVWMQMQQAVPVVSFAVMNPANGAGAAPDSNYTAQIAAARAAGVRILGYVYSSYAARDAALLETDIDNYYSWYGVDGIFIDEADNNCANEPYYESLKDYVKGKGGPGLVAINPGTITPECFAAAADVILNFEGSFAQYQSWVPWGWESGYDPSRFWHLVYATAEADMPTAVLQSQQRGAGFVYVTPDTLPNPWDTLPQGSYWTGELAYVQPTAGACPAAVTKPKLMIKGTSTVDADDSLKFSGAFALAGNPAIDPSASGLRFVISDQSGAKADITLAAGAYASNVGWSLSGSKWTYRDDRDPPADGVTKATLKVTTDGTTTDVGFRVFGKGGSFPVDAAELPLAAALLLDPAQATAMCATAAFPGPKPVCAEISNGVRCK